MAGALGGTQYGNTGILSSGSGLIKNLNKGILIQSLVISSSTTTNVIVPLGATICDCVAIGSSGGSGGRATGSQSAGGPGGGGGSGRSLFTVTPGQILVVSAMTAGIAGTSSVDGGNGTLTFILFNGSIIAQGDGGSGGVRSTGSGVFGIGGNGGQLINCIGNFETRYGGNGLQNGISGNSGNNTGGNAGVNYLNVSINGSVGGINNGGASNLIAANPGLGYGAGPSGPSTATNTATAGGLAGNLGCALFNFYAS